MSFNPLLFFLALKASLDPKRSLSSFQNEQGSYILQDIFLVVIPPKILMKNLSVIKEFKFWHTFLLSADF